MNKEKQKTEEELKEEKNLRLGLIFVSIGSAICGGILTYWITHEVMSYKTGILEAKIESLRQMYPELECWNYNWF